ncbi:MAG: cytochrome o ubiquinol oxidase subunit III [Chromatiales bacterium]|jgi:cytochrome o ubiquinol oxidase subunit 3
MTTLNPAIAATPAEAGHHDHAVGHHDAEESRVFGFWIYILSDLILFSALFATFTVQMHSYAGGATGKDLFDLGYVAVETLLLLLSSAAYGFAMIAVHGDRRDQALRWLCITFLLGLSFVLMEVHEFRNLILEGQGPDRSGFLSAYFTLVGTHGLHVSFGLLWILVMTAQVAFKGLTAPVRGRLQRLSLFWHFLDIVWIGVFSLVYLTGVRL